MNTEHLHQTLSPQAYAALLDGLQAQAERQRRAEQRAFGSGGWRRIWRAATRAQMPTAPFSACAAARKA
ncbi:MAG: hypothetical protein A2W72_04360 [Burkholderiales bacterium RIFCSPLOWO2_12_67_14]|nr:MAG: hypothetical protein A3I64_13235 [Burkholderiales bacterium RIFCSPLOWO2_02_FULL_67_64]OGB37495.1 MAG: hypothetical protein A3E51_24010 [Burkholderiales bacterium RIFCSPHIGHO2_12_FULL_67_38]OGB43827.1 MAG: hypothetical protein A2W72_04360 [Burkholderiales bacterium RIFCSPLOWO2_12_67_14]